MVHLFKSHFSIGKSILTIPRIFELAGDEVVLVEDSMSGFRSALKEADKTGKTLRFGLRLDTSCGNEPSKVIYFARNNKGVDSLRRIYTKAFTGERNVYDFDKADLDGIQVAIPFYDSFVHRNIHHFGVHNIDYPEDTIFFEEDNGHPFDFQISRALQGLGVNPVQAQSVFYEEGDFIAWQFYKSVCNRQPGKPPNFHRPEIEDCGSNQFHL